MVYYIHSHRQQICDFFLCPKDRKHILYEALRKSYIENIPDKDICKELQINYNTFRSLKQQMSNMIRNNEDPAKIFFVESAVGKRQKHEPGLVEKIVLLRTRNLSVPDIKAMLSSQGIQISLWKIDRILKGQNLPPLARRTQKLKQQINVPDNFKPPESCKVDLSFSEKFESLNGSIFLFYPILKSLDIERIIERAGYPETSQISRTSSLLSFLALKLISTKRLSHSNDYGHDRGLGLFAALNVLPKEAWFGGYSHRVSRQMNISFLRELNIKVEKIHKGSGDFNLDFTTIPHWGEESVLERNWSGTRRIGLKSVLALLVQDQDGCFLKYGDAEIKHKDKADAILEFVDFYKGNGGKINCLIFDSKFTTYSHLDKLNRDKIKFLTLRRRSKNMVEAVNNITKEEYKAVKLNKKYRRKYRNLLVAESNVELKDYEGKLRQIIITNNGREQPAFLITNDFEISLEAAVLKYASRWLVEQAISEQIDFYHLNRLNSSIVVKVDFDLTISILADTLYKLFSLSIPGFENSKAETIYRLFIKNYTHFTISDKKIIIALNKKVHLPLLYETDWFDKNIRIPWLDNHKIQFVINSSL